LRYRSVDPRRPAERMRPLSFSMRIADGEE
jgi:hypothetical protein